MIEKFSPFTDRPVRPYRVPPNSGGDFLKNADLPGWPEFSRLVPARVSRAFFTFGVVKKVRRTTIDPWGLPYGVPKGVCRREHRRLTQAQFSAFFSVGFCGRVARTAEQFNVELG